MPLGKLKYSITNFLAGDNVTLYSSSEDAQGIYTLDKLFNVRPSYPFRFQGIGTTSGNIPEDICADLGEAKRPTFTAIFNHNFAFSQSGDMAFLQACSAGCPYQSGPCDWDITPGSGGPECEVELIDRVIDNHNNFYKCFDCGADYQYYRWSFIDAGNPLPFIEIGELFLGEWQELANAHLQPGRADGPEFFEASQITSHGQIWSNYYAEAEHFEIEIINKNDPAQISDLRLFLSEVKQANGKFVFIPDDYYKFVYYVHLRNVADFGQQLVKAQLGELYSWKLSLRTLLKGVNLIG